MIIVSSSVSIIMMCIISSNIISINIGMILIRTTFTWGRLLHNVIECVVTPNLPTELWISEGLTQA